MSGAQTGQPAAAPALPAAQTVEPLYREDRGVAIGVSKGQVRRKLGTPAA